ncbi:hypothetical protein BPT24_206 [Tenacibaculum phage pT24]|uniref:Uncharacterized protein n=1 Tax=Tenacibaculum phage pT24 TaxID=1880590 RepID=A0A1B4XWZ5_9CAUD|nr:hypothetical protein HYP10_gp206 [Tenacibaculum phage pT24]BAV39330.1 hypothetical protein BPT24_206 [Tenacibaculum phage pT24]
MRIEQYLTECLVTESMASNNASVKIEKLLKTLNLNHDKGGFEPFGKDGKAMFLTVMKEVINGVFDDINYSDLKDLNKGLFGKDSTKIEDAKNKNFMKKAVLIDSEIQKVVHSISKIVKWDAVVFVEAMNQYLQSQGFNLKLIHEKQDK